MPAGPGLVTQLRGHLSRFAYPLLGRTAGVVLRHRINNGGCIIATDTPYITPDTVARLFLGRYEAPELNFIRHWLPRDLDVVELGASIGVGTAHIARRLAAERQLICVEANPPLVPLIRANVERNAPGRRLVVLNQAIDYSGQPTVRLQLSATNTNSHLGSDPAGLAVAATTLSAIIAQFGLRAFALVVDIEGTELELILHDAPALSQVQFLLIELHATDYQGEHWTPDQMRDALLARHHFRLLAAHGPVYVFDRPAPPAA